MSLQWKHKSCQAEEFAICNQRAIGTTNDTIREKAMFKDWILTDLRTANIKYESAAASKERISGVQIKKLGGYLQTRVDYQENLATEKKMLSMWYEIYSWTHKTMQSYQYKRFKLQEDRVFCWSMSAERDQ